MDYALCIIIIIIKVTRIKIRWKSTVSGLNLKIQICIH